VSPASPELWIFGYGSLMWRPGFDYAERRHASLRGWRRCFCIYSTHHRGTGARPGMVLGLDRGGACEGIAYRIAPEKAAATLGYLRAREQVNGVYRELAVPIELATPPRRVVRALAFVVERAHPSYAGSLALGTQARLIRGARGISGPNLDYLINTVAHLKELGIREPALERLLVRAGPLFRHARPCPVSGARSGCRALLAASRSHGVEVPRMRPGERRRFVHRKQLAVWATADPRSGATA
jgi:cation transport protein ChaC